MVDYMEIMHLQGIGKMPAIKAKELKPGMITVWNFGYKEKIVDIIPTKTGKSIKCTIISMNSGGKLTRTLRVDRLVAIEKEDAR